MTVDNSFVQNISFKSIYTAYQNYYYFKSLILQWIELYSYVYSIVYDLILSTLMFLFLLSLFTALSKIIWSVE